MKVDVGTFSDLLSEIKCESTRLFERCVRCRVDRTPQQKEEITFEVGVTITTLVVSGEGEWILEYIETCGVDDITCDDLSGSKAAQNLVDRLTSLCDDLELSVRPGKLEAT